jgi:hypothetical protein
LVSKAETVSSSGGNWQFLYKKTILSNWQNIKICHKSMAIIENIITFAANYQGVPTSVG